MSISVILHNDDVGDLFVSVTDLNLSGRPIIVKNQRINEDQILAISVQEDGNGSGNITWVAQRTDDPSKTAQRTITATDRTTVDVSTYFG